ncbi:murein L,D-transpeptidase family protein [Desulfococcus sp.]|uniref:L,D-transpeptidase family protein n=1 Tax=Desulfococcus sp. TaxID=2025834 RepID=UPI0035945DD5
MKKRNMTAILACWSLLWSGVVACAAPPPMESHPRASYPADRNIPPRNTGGTNAGHPDAGSNAGAPDTAVMPGVFVSHEPGDAGAYAIVVEKSSQSLVLYDMQNQPEPVFRVGCSTGKNYGPKTVSGDAKTPEGVYFFNQEFDDEHLSPIYGVKAFPTDYPNLMDRIALRTGSAIWLHGTDKPLKPFDSNGCVAVENADLLALSPFITVNRTPIIIVDSLQSQPIHAAKETKAAVEDLLKKWHMALETGAYADFIACYGAGAPFSSWWEEWAWQQAAMCATGIPLRLKTKKIAVFRNRNTLVAVCDQYIRAEGTALRVGIKQFFLEYQGGRPVILADTYQALSEISREYPMKNPLVAVSRFLVQALGAAAMEAAPGKVPIGFSEAASRRMNDRTSPLPPYTFDPVGFLRADGFPLPVLERERTADIQRPF